MKQLSPAFPENGVVSSVLSLAHATFYDALPSNAQNRPAVAPGELHPPMRAGFLARSLAALDDWFYRGRQKDREAFLAQSVDLADLERRLVKLERYPHPYF